MKSEHWQQLNRLFHSALEREPAQRKEFLDQACAGDASLRKEVEALLIAHEKGVSVIESPAHPLEVQTPANEPNQWEQIFSHYKILSSLGVGGMGEVYLAYDVILGRKVALKLLPADFIMDANRVRRFQQEARAASALNHPNIITIYETGCVGDRHFIAMEFIDGKALRQRINETSYSAAADAGGIAATGLKLEEVLSIACQVAAALDAAHEVGLVHRDIKPENILVRRRDGYAKVLDFGLAKLSQGAENSVDPEAPTVAQVYTNAGSVMGTASYMSPEQARGERVDARTDLWSLGVVLHEMLTGETPFSGTTSQDVIASILRDEPHPIRTEVPDRLKWIVEKALRKKSDERYQTAREMLSDLRDLQKHENEIRGRVEPSVTSDLRNSPQTRESAIGPLTLSGNVTAQTTLTGAVKRHRSVAIVVLTALVFIVAGITLGLYKFISGKNQIGQNQTKSAVPFQMMKMARLSSSGKVTEAAISPDGKYVVHVVDDGEQQSLRMRQVSTSSDVQINPPANVTYLGLTFSPGGDYLYYNAWDKKTPFSCFQMPVLGGASRRLVVDIDSVVTFSPDGKQLAFVRGLPPQNIVSLYVANADGSAERKLATRKMLSGPSLGEPGWSPDGKVIVWPAADATGSFMSLVEVSLADGSEKTMSSQRWASIGRLTWLRDGSGLIFIASERLASPSQIWYLSYPGHEVVRITNDLNDYLGVSLTADSSALVTVETEQVSNIWIAPNDNAHRATQITNSRLDGAEGLSWTPDGKIVYASRASGNLDLWIVDADGTGQKQLTADAGNNSRPSISADGRYVVFVSDRTGSNHIWRADIDGGNPRQLIQGIGEMNAQASPVGPWIIYLPRPDKPGLRKVSIDGEGDVELVDKPGAGIAISPDGKWVASSRFEPTKVKVAIYPIDGGEAQNILDIFTFDIHWTPDGRALAYIDPNNPANISSQTIDGGVVKRLTDFTSDRIFRFAWSHDGKQLALARGTQTNDVVLISNFRETQQAR